MAVRTAVVAVGILILLAGTIFALQGANVIGGSSFMNGSSTWIYAGGLLAVIGVLIAIMGFASKPRRRMAPPSGTAAGTRWQQRSLNSSSPSNWKYVRTDGRLAFRNAF